MVFAGRRGGRHDLSQWRFEVNISYRETISGRNARPVALKENRDKSGVSI
jgi:hypothetical protein